jgi:hypothetical protein
MNTTEIKLRDSNKRRFTFSEACAIAVGTEPAGKSAFPAEWKELLPKLVVVDSKTPAIYSFPEHV